MEPPTQATTPAMTFSKAGWQILSKNKFFLFHTKWTNLATLWHQVDKMCPGEPEKVFHIDAEFFLNLLLQFPLRLQVIIFIGPINKTSTTYTWLQALWFFPSFFVRRSDRFQYFATSGEWSTSYQSILAAANMFATLSTSFRWSPDMSIRWWWERSKRKRGAHVHNLFRIMGSILHIGYGGPITRINGPASKW